MKRKLSFVTAIAGICALNVHADATLTYELAGPDSEHQTKIISLARFFARIDDPAQPHNYLLFQAGKFFPLYQVDLESRSYTLLTPEVNPTLHAEKKPEPAPTKSENPAAETQTATTEEAPIETGSDSIASSEPNPAAPVQEVKAKASPESEATEDSTGEPPQATLRLTPKSKEIAGVNCRVVEELLDNQPIMRHCMADKARLGITEREVRSLARTFMMARERGYGWLGTATKDEKFVSIASEDLRTQRTLQLQSASNKPLPSSHLRIPPAFTKTSNQ